MSAVQKDVGKEEAMTVAEWAPLVDIAEDDKEYLIKAELPEVKKEDVKVTVNASLSALGYEHNLSRPVICLWDDTHHVGT
jgi:HSP20 family protein